MMMSSRDAIARYSPRLAEADSPLNQLWFLQEFFQPMDVVFAVGDDRIRRLVLPRHRFAAIHAGARGGEFTTRPLNFKGRHLVLNYATSAAGSVQVEIQDDAGRPLPGFGLADMSPLFGDELDANVRWKSAAALPARNGKSIRLRFVLKDADVFALRFAD
jgi:hypothetical protein